MHNGRSAWQHVGTNENCLMIRKKIKSENWDKKYMASGYLGGQAL